MLVLFSSYLTSSSHTVHLYLGCLLQLCGSSQQPALRLLQPPCLQVHSLACKASYRVSGLSPHLGTSQAVSWLPSVYLPDGRSPLQWSVASLSGCQCMPCAAMPIQAQERLYSVSRAVIPFPNNSGFEPSMNLHKQVT